MFLPVYVLYGGVIRSPQFSLVCPASESTGLKGTGKRETSEVEDSLIAQVEKSWTLMEEALLYLQILNHGHKVKEHCTYHYWRGG